MPLDRNHLLASVATELLTNKPITGITFPNRPNTLRPPWSALLGGAVNPLDCLLIQSICFCCSMVFAQQQFNFNQIGSTWQ